MGSSLRYLGCAVGFGFGVVWMTVGLGSAIACLLFAGLGYGAVFMAERAQANARTSKEASEVEAPALEGFDLDHRRDEESPDDATTPLAAEAEYGWPWPSSDDGVEKPAIARTNGQ